MDGSIAQLAAVFESVLGAAADELAREVGVVRRERKLTGSLLVQILVWSWWDNPQATWDDMAENAFRWFDLKITPQALQRRAGLPLVELLQRLCERMLERSMQAQPTTLPILSRFKGVELHDATTLSLTNDLCERFPGCGNQHHCQAAAIKAVVRLEVLSGNVSAAVFGSGREADTKLGPQLPTPQAGSLVMKDRGFFDVAELKRYEQAGAYFLVRPATGGMVAPLDHDEQGRPLRAEMRELPAFLRSQTAGTTQIDQDLQIGSERFGCRLIAVRCDEQLANRRRQKLHDTCRRKGRQPSQNQLTMCEWFVLITNVPRNTLSAAEACVVYRVRWQIELLFKCYKSDSGWDKSRARRGASRLVELMAKWLARLLEHALLAPTGGPLARTSWRARVRRAAGWVAHFARAMGDRRKLLDVLTKTLEHLKQLRPKAKRKTNPSTLDLLNNPNSLGKCLT